MLTNFRVQLCWLKYKYCYEVLSQAGPTPAHSAATLTAQRNKGFRGSGRAGAHSGERPHLHRWREVTSSTFPEKPTAVWNGRAANRAWANVAATASTPAHALLRYAGCATADPALQFPKNYFLYNYMNFKAVQFQDNVYNSWIRVFPTTKKSVMELQSTKKVWPPMSCSSYQVSPKSPN